MTCEGYVLGEYGHLIANEPAYSPSEQFMVLHSKSQFCSAPTRALLLSTYIKWVNVFPEIKPHLLAIFERYRHVLDSDLQQRACEYYALASRPDDDELLQNVCEEIPSFPARESALLNRLNRKLGDTEDKRTWIHGGKEANIDRDLARLKSIKKPSGNVDANGQPDGVDNGDILDTLKGLDLSSGTELKSLPLEVRPPLPPVTHGANVDRWFEKLCYVREGVLYEDVQIQMGIKTEYHNQEGRLAVFLGNKMPAPLTSFTATLHVQDSDTLSVSFLKMPPSTIAPRTQVQQLLNVECKKTFSQPPLLSVSFLAGSHQTVTVRLPVVITKFFEPVKLGPSDFFERWKIIGGPPREAQQIFPIGLDSAGHIDIQKNRSVVSGCSFGILDEVDPNPSNLVGAGVLHTSTSGKVGCLIRVEPNREAKVRFTTSPKLSVSDFYYEALSPDRSQYVGRRSS
jgi:AP-2 complex subunit alpha